MEPMLPTPYCYSIKKAKAIVLGTDPGNLSDRGTRRFLIKVFGIGDGDARYFDGILSNLKLVGLNLENIYVQNLVQKYLPSDTSENLVLWKEAVPEYLSYLKEELKSFNKNIPVLLTSVYLYNALVLGEWKNYKPLDFYTCRVKVPVPAESNLLKRPLIPFYRNRRGVDYHLSNSQWDNYKKLIIKIIDNNSDAFNSLKKTFKGRLI